MGFITDLATHIKSWANNKFATASHQHDAAYEAKNANIQTHIGTTGNPHGTTKADVGLGNVTNNAQMKKNPSSVSGNIPTWDGITGDTLTNGFATETVLSNDANKIAVSSAVYTAIQNATSGLGGGMKTGVQDLAALKALDTTNSTNYPDTVLILVETLGLYRLDRQSSTTNDDNFVIAPTVGVGRWLKISNSLTDHNLMNSKQGGTTNEFYHVDLATYQALAGTNGTPSGSNKFVTASDVKLTNINSSGNILAGGIEVSAAEWTAFDNALAS